MFSFLKAVLVPLFLCLFVKYFKHSSEITRFFINFILMAEQTELFLNEKKPKEVKNPRGGRDPERHKARNEKILYRFYYYNTIRGLDPCVCADVISSEVDLAPLTVNNVIWENSASRYKITKERPSLKELQAKYPYLVWKNTSLY